MICAICLVYHNFTSYVTGGQNSTKVLCRGAAKTIWLRLEPDGGGRRIAGGALHAPASLPIRWRHSVGYKHPTECLRRLGFRSNMLKIYDVIG